MLTLKGVYTKKPNGFKINYSRNAYRMVEGKKEYIHFVKLIGGNKIIDKLNSVMNNRDKIDFAVEVAIENDVAVVLYLKHIYY